MAPKKISQKSSQMKNDCFEAICRDAAGLNAYALRTFSVNWKKEELPEDNDLKKLFPLTHILTQLRLRTNSKVPFPCSVMFVAGYYYEETFA